MRYLNTLGALALALLLPVEPLQAATITVYAYNTEFSLDQPGQPVDNHITITAGDVVQWQNLQGNHTTTSVVGSAEQWNAPLSSSTPTFSYQFNTPGTYWYYCIPHGQDNGDGTASGMHGSITVLAAGSGACCLTDGTCTVTDGTTCSGLGGTFQGAGTSCTPNPCATGPQTVTLEAMMDNTLYSEDGSTSNGGGTVLYSGVRQNNVRRTLVAFDLSGLPAGATITAAELRMTCTTLNTAQDVVLYRLLEDWGEGTAVGSQNSGGAAGTGDATWTHRSFNTVLWTNAGGHFSPTATASQNVSATGLVTWTSAQLLADVQMWQAMPAMNTGWIVRGQEVTNNVNVHFASRENATVASRPQLVLTYTPPGPTGACCMPDGSCTENEEGQCTAMGGTWFGQGTTCAGTYCTVSLTPFLDPLPLPGVAQPVTGSPGAAAHYRMPITEQFQTLHSQLPPTRTWGYVGSYPGPTIEARRGEPITVQWVNDLRVGGAGGPLYTEHPLPVDTCMHGPNVFGTVPVTVTHLHGGKVEQDSDGYPEDWFAPGDSADHLYNYPNIQQAATLWYHDHALGITSKNVMMGLAGFYLVRDDVEDALSLPSGEFEVPMAIQDRQFKADGSFRYPEGMHDHFFGDKILVNGKVWPYLDVKQGKYRFRWLNGSNSRAYTLKLSNGAGFHQIGTDGGLMEAPVPVDSVTILPGERADVVIDFAGYPAGTEIILTNNAPAPFPGFPGVGVVPNVMKFIVQGVPGHVAPLPAALAVVPEIPESEAWIERVLELKTIPDVMCQNNTHPMWTIDGLMWDDITEQPIQGATEIWTWKNASGISHPMHKHLEFGRVLNRQAIDEVTGQPTGPLIPPAPNEEGWKDTWDAPTGYFTRILMRFDAFTGLYPYHCHILEHEDHEMMRQFLVVDPVRVSLKAFLEGPFDAGTGLMHDSLRVQGRVPLVEPYTDLGWSMFGGSAKQLVQDQLDESGPESIVDWVVVELRDGTDPSVVLRTRTALLLRNGDVVSPAGDTAVFFDVVPGNYHVALRHRNHLGVMSAAPLALSATPVLLDLTDPLTPVFGTEARKSVGPVAVLWTGEVVRDALLKYTGAGNDRDPILQRIGGSVPTNTASGYLPEDVTLDGQVKYTGAENDRDRILQNVGGVVPTATRAEQLP